ncbi:hypothetical protein [Streptomyces virginiae]
MQFASDPAVPAVHAYFVDGRLCCVAADAARAWRAGPGPTGAPTVARLCPSAGGPKS